MGGGEIEIIKNKSQMINTQKIKIYVFGKPKKNKIRNDGKILFNLTVQN